MFLLLYTFAAIANIVAKNHNFYIDNETNPYLRVKRSIDTSSIPIHANEIHKISSSDVKVNFKNIDESVDFKRKQLKPNRKIAEPNLNSDVNINYIDTKSSDSNFASDIEPIEFNINKLIFARKHNDDAGDIKTLLRTNRDDDKENGSEPSYSNVIFPNDLDKSSANVDDDNNVDQTLIQAKTDQKNRHKRSYYLPILRPDNDYDRKENERQITTPRIQNTTDHEVTTVYEDTNTTSNSIDKQTSTTPLYNDYGNSDYDNDGYFVKTPPKKVDYYGNNKTEKYPSTIENNNRTDNKTQAYYPLSHTYIPGYNKPDDVFNFEKGPVFTNTTRKGNEQNETNLLKSNETLKESNLTKEESKFEENGIDMNNLKRVKRSYYIQQPNKPGRAPEYYPLSHTYIPGYNTQDDVFDFEQGSVLPNPKIESHEDRNATKGDHPKTNPKNSNDKNKKNDENTTKQVPSKNKKTQTTSSHSTTTKKPNREDYDDFFQSPQKNHGKTTAESRPNKNKHTPTNKKNKSNEDNDSLDYKNDGDFIVRAPNTNNGNHKPVNRRKPNHNNNKQNGAHHYVPHPTANTKSRSTTTKKSNTKSNPRYIRRRITRLKRSYYMPIYENENNSRKKVKGYYPLSHTYIPGYNEQDDVWNYGGGNVYPYPNNNNGYDTVSTDNQPPSRQDHRNNKPKQYDTDEFTENTKHKTRNNGRDNHETEGNNNKDESLLSKIVNPIKKLFGYRKKRSIKFENDNNADDAIIVRKRNGVTDFFNNMVEKVYNYTRRDQTVVIDENNIYHSPDINSNINEISSGVQSEEYSNSDQYNPYNSRYSTYKTNYPDYNRNTHASGYQDPYQSNVNQVNNIPYYNNNLNYYINHNSIPQNAKHEDEVNDNIGTERNDVGTDREVNGIDGNDDTTETELPERLLKETCIMCQSMGCPKNHKRRGFICVRIG